MHSRRFRSFSALAPPLIATVLAPATVAAGDLDVTPGAAWTGDYGLAVIVDDAASTYVETTTPDGETRYVVRFYFDADGLALGAAGSIVLFQALAAPADPVVTLRLESDGGAGKRLVYTVATDSGDASTPPIAIAAGWHSVELDWQAATAPGADDGSLSSRLDDVPTAGLSDLDNDESSIELARWGALAPASSPAGTLWLDDFASRRSGPIGPVLPGSLDVDGNGEVTALEDGILLARAFFELRGSALVAGDAVGAGCRWCTSPEILARLAALLPVLDVDANGSVSPLTDALLVLRHLLGDTGAVLTEDAVGPGAARDDPADVAGYVDSLK